MKGRAFWSARHLAQRRYPRSEGYVAELSKALKMCFVAVARLRCHFELDKV